jgi:hypothetical protein
MWVRANAVSLQRGETAKLIVVKCEETDRQLSAAGIGQEILLSVSGAAWTVVDGPLHFEPSPNHRYRFGVVCQMRETQASTHHVTLRANGWRISAIVGLDLACIERSDYY